MWLVEARREGVGVGGAMSVVGSIDSPLRGRASEPQPQIMVMFVWGYCLLILKFWIHSFVKMPEALVPVGHPSCVASAAGGPILGVMGVGSGQRGQPGTLLQGPSLTGRCWMPAVCLSLALSQEVLPHSAHL